MKVIVIYESTRGRTKAMAEAICEGVKSAGAECDIVEAKDFTSLGDACAVAVGSSTRMKRPLPKVRQILGELTGIDGKGAGAFGSYGWSGEAPDDIAKLLGNLGANLADGQPVKAKDYPNENALNQCRDLGMKLAESCK